MAVFKVSGSIVFQNIFLTFPVLAILVASILGWLLHLNITFRSGWEILSARVMVILYPGVFNF